METRTLKLWLVEEREKARLFLVNPPESRNRRTIWIPRSLTHHLSKDMTSHPNPCVVAVEDWFLEKNEL